MEKLLEMTGDKGDVIFKNYIKDLIDRRKKFFAVGIKSSTGSSNELEMGVEVYEEESVNEEIKKEILLDTDLNKILDGYGEIWKMY